LKKSQTANKLLLKYQKLANEAMEAKKYDVALRLFSLALKLDPNNIDLKVGAILSDYANEDMIDVTSLYDLYYSSIDMGESKENTYENIKQMIKREDILLDELLSVVEEVNESIDGIAYHDFLKIAKTKPSMKEALEDLMFSTKLIINKKEDMMSFIELLYHYDFKNEAFAYLENAITIFPSDTYFEDKFREFLDS